MNKEITFGSVCSGIEAASVAWEPIGFKPKWFSQYDPENNYSKFIDFPSAVLAHHWPDVKNLGDMTNISEQVYMGNVEAPEILVGGTPCQAFSVAGLREGLSDERGELTLKYVELANAIDNVRIDGGKRESIIVWENVPGVLSSKDNAFGCFLAGLAGEVEPLQPSGKRWSNAGCVFGTQRAVAWRIIDAQYFGVPQRRRRVFVVASARNGLDPTKILFEPESLSGNTEPSGKEEKETAINARKSIAVGSHWDDMKNAHPTLTQSKNIGGIGSSNQEFFSQRGSGIVPHGFRMVAFGEYADDQTASTMKARDYKDATDLAVHVVDGTQDPCVSSDKDFALGRNNGAENAVFGIPGNWIGHKPENGGNVVQPMNNLSPCLTATDRHGFAQLEPLMVRRLMPVECERLQGFPDGHTDIIYKGKTSADGHRYKALGNSMAVPVMRWIGEQIKNELNRLQLGTK